MKKLIAGITLALGLFLFGPRPAYAVETFKPLHTSVQPVLSSTTLTGAISSTSTVIDLSGGDLTSISCAFYIQSASSTGTPTLDAAIQISPDGTNYVNAGTFTQITSTATATVNGKTFLKQSVFTGPGVKARVVFTGSANTSWVGLKAWCLPTVE